VEDRTQNKKDWSLEILTPAQMETFLKDFNSETIQYYEYLNDMESTINKQKDILIKSQELDKDFTNRKSNLNKSAQNLDGGRSSEIEKIEAELNAEVSKADIIRTVINDKLREVENGVASIETVSVEVIEKSSFKSYTDKYNRLRSEITKMQDSVLNRDVKKENQTILDESKKAAEMDGGTAVEPTTGHFFASPASYNVTYSNTKGGDIKFTDLSPNENGYLVFEGFQLRPNTAKPGTFEFRHPTWEGYGIAEWIAVDGFGEGTEITFNIDIGKAIETFTVTYDSGEDADGPGDGLKSDHPISEYKYWAVPMELANNVEDSGTALEFAQLLIDDSNSEFEIVDGILTAYKVSSDGQTPIKQTLTYNEKGSNWTDSEYGDSVGDFVEIDGIKNMSWIGENGFGEGSLYKVNSEEGIVWYGVSGELHQWLEDLYMTGDGLKSDHPLEDYVYLYDTNGSIDSTIASFQSFKSEGGVYMESNPLLDGALTSQPDSKGGYYKLVNDGEWKVNFFHPELGESQSLQSSKLDFEQFMSPEFTLAMGSVYKITLSQVLAGISFGSMEDRYIYAVSSTWYNSLEGGGDPSDEEPSEKHIKSTGTYGLQQAGSFAKIPGEVVETAKLGNILTFTSGPATSYQIRTGVEGLDVVKITTNGENESVLIQGTAFLQSPEGEMLSFSEPSEKEGGEDIQWTVTWESGTFDDDEDGENTATHLVDGGTYSYSWVRGSLAGLGVNATAIANNLTIGGWKISPDPMSKSSDAFIAQQVIEDKETGEESYGVGIQIGLFSNDSISWTTAPLREEDEDTVHTISYLPGNLDRIRRTE
jgi:hypothetical protein